MNTPTSNHSFQESEPDFHKYADGLVPAIVQHANTGWILMQGYMNEESFRKTLDTRKVCFYSRSRQQLWLKGETSGHYLEYKNHFTDCDSDSILVFALPAGPTCHTGNVSCFGYGALKTFIPAEEENSIYSINIFNTQDLDDLKFLTELEFIIEQRKTAAEEKSYVSKMFRKGIAKMAQKVGEEATELVIEAMQQDNGEAFEGEAADLLFHYLILLNAKGSSLARIAATLKSRNNK